MLRKLPLATAVALALMPFQSHALGLGSISTNSVLNEEFDAEIQLLSVPAGELDTVKASLASPETFERLGIERPYILSRLRFEPERKQNGQAVIKVSSRELIQEPFLNFLVEINWPKGRMVREFTVLLDPPLTTRKKASPVSAPRSAAASRTSTTSASQVTARPSTTPALGSGEYGPVKRNETLWTIAERYSGGDISVHQMMHALLQANPQAFSDNNINTLKAGSILRVPTREEAMSLSRAEAARLSDSHYEDWKRGLAARTPVAPVEEPAVMPEAAEEPVKDADEKPVEPVAETETVTSAESIEDEARLKLSGTDVTTADGTGADSDASNIRDELITAQEKVVSSQGEVQDMMDRMSLMERQLGDMQRLLELKDEQLSQLQSANQDLTQQVENAASQPPVPVNLPEPEPVVSQPVEVEKPAPAKPAPPKSEMDKVNTVIDLIMGSAVLMGISIAVLVVLLALIWAAFSRRKSPDETSSAMPTAAAAAAGTAAAAGVAAGEANQAEEEEETSFLREFESGEMDGFKDMETGESDPLAEADVYIAYGRYDQAEKMISDALTASPGNRALQNKLLEIFYANKEQEKFNGLAADMHNSGAEAEDPDSWNRIKLMGADIDPENGLYADAMDAPSVDLNDSLDLNDALNELESQMSQDPQLSSMLPDADTPEELSESAGELLEEELTLDAGLDEQEIAAVPVEEDLDLDLSLEESPADDDMLSLPEEDSLLTDAKTASDIEDTSLDDLAAELETFNLDDMQDDGAADLGAANDLDDLSLAEDFNLDDDFGELSDELAGMDDVSTKLDLAKAYIEMGDLEGAKGILEEVVNEGNAAQQQEAKDLITNMG